MNVCYVRDLADYIDYFVICVFKAMETEDSITPVRRSAKSSASLLPEVEVFLQLLTLIYLIDLTKYKEVCTD